MAWDWASWCHIQQCPWEIGSAWVYRAESECITDRYLWVWIRQVATDLYHTCAPISDTECIAMSVRICNQIWFIWLCTGLLQVLAIFWKVNRPYAYAVELIQSVPQFGWALLLMCTHGWPFQNCRNLEKPCSIEFSGCLTKIHSKNWCMHVKMAYGNELCTWSPSRGTVCSSLGRWHACLQAGHLCVNGEGTHCTLSLQCTRDGLILIPNIRYCWYWLTRWWYRYAQAVSTCFDTCVCCTSACVKFPHAQEKSGCLSQWWWLDLPLRLPPFTHS